MCVDTTKTPDRNDLKLSTIVVFDTMSKYIDFGFKRSRSTVLKEYDFVGDFMFCQEGAPQKHRSALEISRNTGIRR